MKGADVNIADIFETIDGEKLVKSLLESEEFRDRVNERVTAQLVESFSDAIVEDIFVRALEAEDD